jgi:DNA-binding CsgD family transcriptional regulator
VKRPAYDVFLSELTPAQRRARWRRKQRTAASRRDVVARMWRQGVSAADIAKRCDITPQWVYKLLRQLGLKL